MKNEKFRMRNIWVCVIWVVLMCSCATKTYQIQSIKGSFVEMDSTFDKSINPEMLARLDSYKVQLDKKMSVVIGEAARTLTKAEPQYELVYLTANVMKQYGDAHGGVDLSFMNVDGHRTELNKGKITIGNMFEIYSFDNMLVFLDLNGEYLAEIFDRFAKSKPQGFSSNVQLTIQDGKAVSVLIDGKEIDKSKTYKIITVDYLAEGNDNMSLLKNATSVQQTGITLREIMINYVKQEHGTR